jgi:4-diphosphocytidyl-2-C-methyl-D-erythritol kinase
MICFPNAKINLGLNITEKRADGFHTISTLFYPIQWRDALECVENTAFKKGDEKIKLSLSGIKLGGKADNNLVTKVYKVMDERYKLPPVHAHLHKAVPMGAGLGGGSSDAAFFVKLLNEKFNLEVPVTEQMHIAGQLGSDCAFFIENKPVFAGGKGNVFSPANINLDRYYILIVYPAIHSNTAEAYRGIMPSKPQLKIEEAIACGIKNWKDKLVNDFEPVIFARYPELQKIKNNFYKHGAIYASMSGSGSSVYGIFEKETDVQEFKFPANYLTFTSANS